MRAAESRRFAPTVVVGLLAVALAWGLSRYGGTEPPALYRLFLVTAVPAGLALLLRPPRPSVVGDWLLAAVGLYLLLQVALRSTLAATGYLHWALGWMALYVAYRVGGGVAAPSSRAAGGGASGTDAGAGGAPGGGGAPRLPGDSSRVPRPARLLVLAFVALGALEALYGLEQVISGDVAAGSGEHLAGMATGTFVNRNHYAGFLNLILPLAIGALYAAYARRWGRSSRTEMLALAWTVLLASAFIGVAVLLSRSRGGTVTLILTVVFTGTLLALGRRTSRRGLSSVASATLAGLILLLGLAVGLDALLARFAETDQTETRLAVYGDTLELIGEAPLAGVGPGMYRWRFRPYQTADLGSRYYHAHNDYLETAAEWGLPLALAFWVFVLARLRGVVLMALSSKDPWRRGLALGLAGSIASILIHSLFDFNLQIPANLMVFAAVLGMAWGVSEVAPEGKVGRGGSSSRLGLALGVVLVAVLIFAAFGTRPRLAAVDAVGGATELAELERAVELDPTNPEIRFVLAVVYRDHPEHRDLAAAREQLERATELNPHAWRYWLELSRLEELADRPVEAEEALRRSVELNPRRGDYRWRLANFHLRRGARREAFEELAAGLRLDPALERPAFQLLLKAGASFSEIERLWPEAPENRLALLRLACRDLPAGAPEPDVELLDGLWRGALEASEAPTVDAGGFFVSYLLEQGAGERARAAWIELSGAAELEDPAYAAGENLVWNGGFELPVAVSSPLAWRVTRGDGFRMMRQTIDGADGNGLRIDFEGENVDFRHLSQQVVVPAGVTLRLAARLASRDLTTESGVLLEVLDGSRVIAATEPVLGTRLWHEVEAVFDAPAVEEAASRVLEVRLRRRPSHRIAGKIEGTALVDDIRLAPLLGESEPAEESVAPVATTPLDKRVALPDEVPLDKRVARLDTTTPRLDKRMALVEAGVTTPLDKGVAPPDEVPLDRRVARLDKGVALVEAGERVAPGVGWGRGWLGVLVRLGTGQVGEGWLEIVSQEGVAVVWDGVEIGRTGDGGRLVIEGIPPGTYTLGLSKEGYRNAGQRISIEAGENRLERFLEPAGPLGPPEWESGGTSAGGSSGTSEEPVGGAAQDRSASSRTGPGAPVSPPPGDRRRGERGRGAHRIRARVGRGERVGDPTRDPKPIRRDRAPGGARMTIRATRDS